jgi:hypothetical protein
MTWAVEITPVTEQDMEDLLANIREADLEESRAATPLEPKTALRLSVNMSEEAYAGKVNGQLVCIFGVARKSMLSDEGIPWLVGTDLVERYGILVAKRSRNMVRLWRNKYTSMRNFVYVKNAISIRWLKWLGFTIHEPVPYGIKGLLFHPFEMRT